MTNVQLSCYKTYTTQFTLYNNFNSGQKMRKFYTEDLLISLCTEGNVNITCCDQTT